MSFLKNIAKVKGYYVVAIGKNLFSEYEDNKYTLYIFPFQYHARYYLDSFTEKSFTLSFLTVKQLWDYRKDTKIVIASVTPDGKPVFQDLLFPTEDCILH